MSTPIPRPAAIVFDMDGLMVDTEPLAQQIWADILRQYGHDLSPAVYARIVGRRTDFSAQLLLALYPMPLTAAELAALKHNRWTARWRQGVPAMPGLHELHAALIRRGIPWAVATSSPRDYAEFVLHHLGLWPTRGAIAAGTEVQQGKPAPDIYLLAAGRLGVPPMACLALEDSVPGGQAAVAAGMTLVAVPNGTTTADDFPFAAAVLPSLSAVAARLADWF